MDAEPPKPFPSRPHILRQRSQSAVTKSSLPNDAAAADSDASKRSSLRHKHAHSHHHIPHHPKRFAKDILGLQNGQSNAELAKQSSRISEGLSAPSPAAGSSLNESRKGSTTAGHNVDGAVQGRLDDGNLSGVSADELERMMQREQWKNKARQSELKNALHVLSEESMKATRRLDDLYYNLLEKLSGLHSTINSLRELSSLTAQLHNQFKTETDELSSDLQKQTSAFGGFRAQQGKIGALDARVRESKQRADGLSERLEVARKRVSALEEREKEYQDSISWRLRWMWIILGTVVGIIVAIAALPYLGYGPEHVGTVVHQQEQAKQSLESLTSVPQPVKSFLEKVVGTTINTSLMYDTLGSLESSRLSSRTSSRLLEPTSPAGDDPLQKIFDEL